MQENQTTVTVRPPNDIITHPCNSESKGKNKFNQDKKRKVPSVTEMLERDSVVRAGSMYRYIYMYIYVV